MCSIRSSAHTGTGPASPRTPTKWLSSTEAGPSSPRSSIDAFFSSAIQATSSTAWYSSQSGGTLVQQKSHAFQKMFWKASKTILPRLPFPLLNSFAIINHIPWSVWNENLVSREIKAFKYIWFPSDYKALLYFMSFNGSLHTRIWFPSRSQIFHITFLILWAFCNRPILFISSKQILDRVEKKFTGTHSEKQQTKCCIPYTLSRISSFSGDQLR